MAKYDDIKVTPDEKGVHATAISWTFKTREDFIMSHPGVYVLCLNILDWESFLMCQTDTTLTDIEVVFRSLKSELEQRPSYHDRATLGGGICSSVCGPIRRFSGCELD